MAGEEVSRLPPPPWAGIVLPSPDQSRYGPATIPVNGEPHEREGLILYAAEGGGTTGTCPCGWLRWHQKKDQVKTWGRDHAAPRKKGEGVTYDCPELRRLEK
jgi:hypothetical protein